MCGHQPCEKPDCTWTEKHRAECEARLVMLWDKPTRLAYYADVKKKRGEAAAQQLIEETKRQWRSQEPELTTRPQQGDLL
jgi:hypothetical protein